MRDGFPHQYKKERKLLHILSIPEFGYQERSVGLATSYVLDGPEFQTWYGTLVLSARRPYTPALGPTHTAFYSKGNGSNVNLTIHLYLVSKSSKSGTIPLLPISTFMAWTETILRVPISCEINKYPINLTCGRNNSLFTPIFPNL